MNCIEQLFSMPQIYEVARFTRKQYIITMLLLVLFHSIILFQGFLRGEITDLIYLVTICMIPLYIRAAKLRLNDAGMSWIWLMLPFTGVGNIYFLYLMLFKPSTTDSIRTIVFTDEHGEEVECQLLDSFMYDDDRFVVLACEDNGKNNPASTMILRVKSSNVSFDTVGDKLYEELFNEFKERNLDKYEYV